MTTECFEINNIIQISVLVVSVLPLIISEVLPFLSTKCNGLIHAIFLWLRNN
jgi:hypothetical protein